MIDYLKRYFGKDWKFFWTTSKLYNIIIASPFAKIGLLLFNLSKKLISFGVSKSNDNIIAIGTFILFNSRKMMRIGGKNCSWCGAEQNRNTGLFMSYSRKGLRCSNKDCQDKPYV